MVVALKTCPFCSADLDATVVASWDVFLQLEPPSQNAVKGNVKDFRARKNYQLYRDEYFVLLKNASFFHEIPRARTRRRVVFTRLFAGRGRAYDRGNLIGGMKPLLDAMTAVGVIHDDSEEWLEDHYRQNKANTSGVRLQIEELK